MAIPSTPFFRRPSYWIAGYDDWHLPVIAVWAMAVLGIATVPNAASQARTPTPLAQPPPVRPLAATRLQQPADGTVFRPAQPVLATGIAEPGVIVRLYNGQQFLAETLSGLDGKFQFQLAGIPSGTNWLRAVAVAPGRVAWSEPARAIVAPPQSQPHHRTTQKLKSRH